MKALVDLLIFDFDGTLVDSRDDIVTSVNLTLSELGLPERKPGEITGFIGTGVKQLMADALGTKDPEKIKKAVEVYKDFYRSHMFDRTRPYPNAEETLKYFDKKKKAVISNKSVEFIKISLKKFAMEKYFIKISGGDNDKCRKPDPCPILDLMKQLEVSPKKAIIIGDSALDMQTGKAAGILTCGALYGIGRPDKIKALKPDFMIGDIGDLRNILE